MEPDFKNELALIRARHSKASHMASPWWLDNFTGELKSLTDAYPDIFGPTLQVCLELKDELANAAMAVYEGAADDFLREEIKKEQEREELYDACVASTPAPVM